MLNNCNRVIRSSLQGGKSIQKNIHLSSIILKPPDLYSNILYLPLCQVVGKRLQNQSYQAKNLKKVLEGRVKLGKSPNLKNCNRKQIGRGTSINKQFKLFNQSQKRIQTDRKSKRKSLQKSMKAIRLKTDYHQQIQASHQKQSFPSKLINYNQVSTKHTQEYSNKIIYISKLQLIKIQKQLDLLQKQNILLQKSIDFCCENQHQIKNNSVMKALKFLS